MYSWLKVMYHPFAIPINNLPAYRPARLVVVIITTLLTQHSALAIHKHWRLPMYVANTPALEELRKAPRVMSEEMSCWRVGEMLYPVGEAGSACPKT